MKASGTEISGMVKASKDIQMATPTSGNSSKERLTVKVFTLGRMERFTMVSGTLGSSKVMVSGKAYKMTHILENGLHPKLMVMAFIPGLMETDMRANGTCA